MTKTGVKIFYCPEEYFNSNIPEKSTSLSELMDEMDFESRQYALTISQNEITSMNKPVREIKNLIISSGEFFRLSDSGLNGFKSILNQFNISKIFIQNPPEHIVKILQLSPQYKVEIKKYDYNSWC